MQSMPMYVGSAAAAPSPGSPAAVQPRLYRGESELSASSAFLRLLAEPMKVDLQPSVPRALTAPPGLEGFRTPDGVALTAPPGLESLAPMPGPFARSFEPPATPPGLAIRKVASDGSDCCSTSAGLDGEASEGSADEDCTTMAILNIPYTYPKCKLQRMMEKEGYTLNYFHFPRDSRRGRNRGFAFVNFTTPQMAQAFRQNFDNMTLCQPGEKEKSITVVPSSLQGFESNRALHPGATARPQMMQRK